MTEGIILLSELADRITSHFHCSRCWKYTIVVISCVLFEIWITAWKNFFALKACMSNLCFNPCATCLCGPWYLLHLLHLLSSYKRCPGPTPTLWSDNRAKTCRFIMYHSLCLLGLRNLGSIDREGQPDFNVIKHINHRSCQDAVCGFKEFNRKPLTFQLKEIHNSSTGQSCVTYLVICHMGGTWEYGP